MSAEGIVFVVFLAAALSLAALLMVGLLLRRITLSRAWQIAFGFISVILASLVTVGNVLSTSAKAINKLEAGYRPSEVLDCLLDEDGPICTAARIRISKIAAANARAPGVVVDGNEPVDSKTVVSNVEPGASRKTSVAPPFDRRLDRDIYQSAESGRVLVELALATRSMEDIKRAADAGDGESLYLFGAAELSGIAGAPADERDARERFRRSWEEHRFPRGGYAYGQVLLRGQGGPPQVRKGLDILEACRKLGHAPCAYDLGQYHAYLRRPFSSRSPEIARPYFEEAALLGFPLAMVELADNAWYAKRQARDHESAMRIYGVADLLGSSDATIRIAQAYRYGTVFDVDKPLALSLLRRAAAKGNVSAASQAATMLVDGEGVPRNPIDAGRLLEEFSCSSGECTGGVWSATDQLAALLISRAVPPIAGRDPTVMAIKASTKGYFSSLDALVKKLKDGTSNWPADHALAATLARPALAEAQHREVDQPGGWIMYQKAFADAIQLAINEGKITEEKPGELAGLESRYGVRAKFMKRFTVPSDCGDGSNTPFYVYIWDAPEFPVPTEAQFDWWQYANNCIVSADIRSSFKKLHQIAKDNGVSFSELAVYALGKAQDDKRNEPAEKTSRMDEDDPTGAYAAIDYTLALFARLIS